MPHLGVEGHGQPKTYREAERFTAAAELALFTAIGMSTRSIDAKAQEQELKPDERALAIRWSPAWPDCELGIRTSALDLLRRVGAGKWRDGCALASMRGINLDRQILRIDLANADWSFASARLADLISAILIGADLSYADLSFTNAVRSDLTEADLAFADLRGADLSEAVLSDANFTYANLTGASLYNVDLSETEGLTLRQLKAANDVNWDRVPPDLPGT